LRLKRSAGPLELEVAARGVGLEPDLARDRDLEVHGDTAAPEEIGPAAILFVEVRLHSDVVALLVHPHLHVLEQSLRALLARAADALARLDLDRAVVRACALLPGACRPRRRSFSCRPRRSGRAAAGGGRR